MVRKVILIVVGALLVVAGIGVGATAVVVHQSIGDAGRLEVPLGTLTPTGGTGTVVVDVEGFSADLPYLSSWATPRLQASSSQSIFLGAGAPADVDALLRGSSYSVARTSGGTWELTTVPGTAPSAAVAQQTFWWATDHGTTASIAVPAKRPLTLVLSSADGRPLGPVSLTAVVLVPTVAAAYPGVLIGSGSAVLLGIVLIVIGSVLRRRRGRHEAADAHEDAVPDGT